MREALTAARILRKCALEKAGVFILDDKGCQGAGTSIVVTPYSGRNKPSPRTKRTGQTPSLTAVLRASVMESAPVEKFD